MRLALLVVLVLALTPAADASVVSVVPAKGPNDSFSSLEYLAEPGEANQLMVTYTETSDNVTVADPGATIQVGGGCESVDAHTAECFMSAGGDLAFDETRVTLRDGDDSAATEGSDLPRLVAFGGAGNDTLIAPINSNAGGPSRLDGGPGADVLDATKGSAVLIEGDPDSDPQPDVLKGGQYTTGSARYSGRETNLVIDLAAGVGGAPGEGDVLDHIRVAYGGQGDDTLVTGPDVFFLSGGKGDDTLRNAGGADEALDLFGGAGLDVYECKAKSPENIFRPEPGELIGPDCTTIADGDWTESPLPTKHTDASVTLRMECPANNAADFRHLACSAMLTLTDPASGKAIGSGAFSQPKGPSSKKAVVIALTARGQKLMRKNKPVDAALKAKGYSTLRWSFKLGDLD